MMSSSSSAVASSECYDQVDAEFIREAVDQAHVNALRLALYQATGDDELGRMRAEIRNVGGREFLDYKLDDADTARVLQKAVSYLASRIHGEPFSPTTDGSELQQCELKTLMTKPSTADCLNKQH